MLRLSSPGADRVRGLGRRRGGLLAALAALLLLPTAAIGPTRRVPPPIVHGPLAETRPAAPSWLRLAGLLEPRPTLRAGTEWPRDPLPSGFQAPAPPAQLPVAALEEPGRAATLAAAVPLPVPRPVALASARPEPRRDARRAAPAPAPLAETRSFFAELFGIDAAPAAPPALAYAALGSGAPLTGPRPRLSPVPAPEAAAGVAVYDISARTVTLPGGERLEAHSGLGDKMDDPRFVHVRMRGATPPGTYELTEREAPFHGVRAIRMNPVGGSAAIHGRAGILAHTYMLGPRGDSNGCLSVRDYDRFLQAFLRGEIRRIVVVAGEAPSGLVGRLFGAAAGAPRG